MRNDICNNTINKSISFLKEHGIIYHNIPSWDIIYDEICIVKNIKPRFKSNKKKMKLFLINLFKEEQSPISLKDNFYISNNWKRIRYQIFKKYGNSCQCCGRTPKEHKISLTVDHIKPRSKFPELQCELNNLQILCIDCNLGKGNDDETDWR